MKQPRMAWGLRPVRSLWLWRCCIGSGVAAVMLCHLTVTGFFH
jgi:hypothetical protein